MKKNGLELVIKADSPIAISYYLAEEVAREDIQMVKVMVRKSKTLLIIISSFRS